jgi:YD repeat-containing protein
MALERAWSRLAALRNSYALFIEECPPAEIPELLGPLYRESWIVERRTLYKDGEESRRQWIFRDPKGVSRLVAVFSMPGPGEAEDGEEAPKEEAAAGGAGIGGGADTAGGDAAGPLPNKAPTGFIELYGENSLISSDRQLSEAGDELVTDYHYNRVSRGNSPPGRELLIRADTWRKFFNEDGQEAREDICTDYYRYTRNFSLRSIERIYYQKPPAEPEKGPEIEKETEAAAETPEEETEEKTEKKAEPRTVLRFPRRSLDSALEEGFVAPAIAYGSQFLEDIQAGHLYRVVYTTDERGRILEEIRQDEEGNTVAELRNIWSGNRLSRVIIRTGEEERITEYEYDEDGNRVKEQDYRNGTLERVVHFQDNREDEELYMNGELILRSQWEGGRKLREERVRPRGGAASRGQP